MTSTVSILIPCFNAERWIAHAIESALAQTWPEKEVIIVDDGSTDRSLQIITSFGDRVRWESGPNRGGSKARNRLLELAGGRWLQYLDADDYLLTHKIAQQMEFVAAHPDADIVFSPVTLEHVEGNTVRQELLEIPRPHDPWILLARWFLPQTGAPLWRAEAVRDAGGWKVDQPCCQEHELYLRLLMTGKHFIYCDHSGAIYRQWGEHTVCKRDKPEVRRRRLDIEQRAELFLRERNELSPERHWAINQARFEIARTAWQHDHVEAEGIVGIIRRSQPDFVPGGRAAPPAYRFAYRAFGFRLAETIAGMRRRLMWRPQSA